MRINGIRLVLIVLVLLSVQACVAPDPRQTPSPYPKKAPPVSTVPAPPPSVRVTPMDIPRLAAPRPLDHAPMAPPIQGTVDAGSTPVVLALLADVDAFEQAGRFDQAASRVERGLRISPKDARLWQRLAEIRLQQRRYEQVVATAKKSNGLARGNAPMQAKNWLLIAEARDQMGDSLGRERARAQAARYQSF